MDRRELLEKLRELKPWLEEQGVTDLRLFGSFARDEAREDSDVDLMCRLTRQMGWDFFGIQAEIAEKIGREVELFQDPSCDLGPRSAPMRTPSLSDADTELFLVMLDALDRIAIYIRGFDQETYLADQRTIDATALNFVVIGECARRLSPDARLNPAGPWIKMAGLRHRIAHGYASVDPSLLWSTASVQAAELRPKIAALLGMT